MSFQPFGIATLVATLGITLMATAAVVFILGAIVDGILPLERDTIVLGSSIFGVLVGKYGIDLIRAVGMGNGGFLSWVSFGIMMGLLCALVISAISVPLGIVDVLLGGESFIVEEE